MAIVHICCKFDFRELDGVIFNIPGYVYMHPYEYDVSGKGGIDRRIFSRETHTQLASYRFSEVFLLLFDIFSLSYIHTHTDSFIGFLSGRREMGKEKISSQRRRMKKQKKQRLEEKC